MDEDKIFVWFLIVLVGILCIAVSIGLFAICQDHRCDGYYLRHGAIYASHPWSEDQKACDYTPEKWQEIVESGLALPSRKEKK